MANDSRTKASRRGPLGSVLSCRRIATQRATRSTTAGCVDTSRAHAIATSSNNREGGRDIHGVLPPGPVAPVPNVQAWGIAAQEDGHEIGVLEHGVKQRIEGVAWTPAAQQGQGPRQMLVRFSGVVWSWDGQRRVVL